MRLSRTARQVAFFAPAVLFIACAADPGDILKLAESVEQGQPTSNGSSSSVSAAPTDTSETQDTGPDSSTSVSTNGSSTVESTSTEGGVGDDASTDAAEAAAPCTTCAVELKYEFATSTGSDQFQIEIINNGTAPLDLSQVTVHYYFAPAGTTSWTYFCDSASIQTPAYVDVTPDVMGTFVASTATAANASEYLNVAFSAAAPMLQSASTVTVQNRFNDPAYTLNQTNDYSYEATGSTFVDNMNITVYFAGSLVWGVEPQ